MKKLAIVYYSRSGNTEKMAHLIAEGANEVDGIEVLVEKVEDFSEDRLPDVDGVIIGSPTYYGSMAAEVKALLDKSVKYHRKLDGKVGAAFTSAGHIGGGNETTITGILEALLVHGMVVQGDPTGDHYGPVAIGAPDERASAQCRKLGKRTADLLKRLN